MPNTPGVADHAAPAPHAAAVSGYLVGLVDTAAAAEVEPKVKAATSAGAGSAAIILPAVLWLLSTYLFHGQVPVPLEGLTGLVVTGVCTFSGGFYARHVDRLRG